MPRGKAVIHGGLILRPVLGDFDLFPQLLAEVRRDRTAPASAQISTMREQLRDAIEVYVGAHDKAELVTATQRQQAKAQLRGCARRVMRAMADMDLREQLLDSIDALDLNARSELHRSLTAHGRMTGRPASLPWLRGHLRSRRPAIDLSALLVVSEFGQGRVRASWKDPFLPSLVRAAAPVWSALTGKSAMYQDLDKRYPFAAWVGRIIDACSGGQLVVLEGTVVDVLRALKIRPVPKSPAT